MDSADSSRTATQYTLLEGVTTFAICGTTSALWGDCAFEIYFLLYYFKTISKAIQWRAWQDDVDASLDSVVLEF